LNQYELILMGIGAAAVVAGIAMGLARLRGWLAAIAIGTLWLLSMAVYTAYKYSGFYAPTGGLAQGSAGPAVTTALGFAIFVVGLGAFIYIYRRGRGEAR